MNSSLVVVVMVEGGERMVLAFLCLFLSLSLSLSLSLFLSLSLSLFSSVCQNVTGGNDAVDNYKDEGRGLMLD